MTLRIDPSTANLAQRILERSQRVNVERVYGSDPVAHVCQLFVADDHHRPVVSSAHPVVDLERVDGARLGIEEGGVDGPGRDRRSPARGDHGEDESGDWSHGREHSPEGWR